MSVKVILIKTFDLIVETESAKYLNKGDIFLPDGTGWEFKVVKKVCFKLDEEYVINVMVKALSIGAKKYAMQKYKPHL